MCGRFTQRISSSEMARIFEAVDHADLPGDRYNVAPTQDVAAVIAADGERTIERLRWGLVPPWADAPKPSGRLINARAETIATSPVYRGSFRSKRCLIPVDGFYEWQRLESGRQPFYIRPEDGDVLALAGLWSSWRDRATDAPPLRTCSIATTTPNDVMAPIHNRMPVLLAPASWDLWLDPATDPAELLSLLRPSEAALTAVRVSSIVNNPLNDGPSLVVPLD
jgi:putative SOS response-associated peptidase YedK